MHMNENKNLFSIVISEGIKKNMQQNIWHYWVVYFLLLVGFSLLKCSDTISDHSNVYQFCYYKTLFCLYGLHKLIL